MKNSDKGKLTLQAIQENTKHLHSEQGRTDRRDSGKPLHNSESIVPWEGTLSAPAKLYNNERHTVGCKGNGKSYKAEGTAQGVRAPLASLRVRVSSQNHWKTTLRNNKAGIKNNLQVG